MALSRRRLLANAAAAAPFALLGARSRAAAPITLKISHQFPVSTPQEGDFRDQWAKKFAAAVAERTHGNVTCEIYPNSSLVKPFSQFDGLRKGTLDMSVLPLAYAAGMVPAVSLGLMPALVQTYEQAMRWQKAPVGAALTKILDDAGVKIVSWIWQAGGIASRSRPIVSPEDMKGMNVRGGSPTFDSFAKAAEASVVNVPSSEIYPAMSNRVLDAAITSSTSLISYRLFELTKALTSAKSPFFWCMFEPALISKAVFQKLSASQQEIVMDVGASLEPFAMESARADDQRLVETFRQAGAQIVDMPEAAFQKWVKLAEQSCYKEFAANVENGQQLLDMARAVPR